MTYQIRTPLFSGLLVAMALTGCGDDGVGPGLPPDFDAFALESSVDDLVVPVQASVGPTSALRDAYPTLTAEGLVFDRHGGTSPILFAEGDASTGSVAFVELPPEVLGKTFVYDAAQQWHIDPNRTDAPTDGVRVAWYNTDNAGNIQFPVTEVGYIDLTDEDLPNLSQLGVRMVQDTPGVTVLGDFTQGYRETTTTQWTSHSEGSGFYSDGSVTVDFDLVTDGSGDDNTGDEDATLLITLAEGGVEYELDVTASETGSSGAIDQLLVATVTMNGLTTVMDLDIAQDASGAQQGQGDLVHDGQVIARIIVEGDRFRYRTPGGEAFSSGTSAQLDSLVRTMFLAGLTVVDRLPFLFP